MLHPRIIDKPLAALVARLPAKVGPVMTFASFIAAPPAIAVIFAVVIASALFLGSDQLLKAGTVALVLSPVAELSKFITRRHRPETLYVQNMRFKTYSFPSGHSYISALVFGFLAIAVSAWQPYGVFLTAFLVILIFLVGISRIFLGAHFPSDVIAGWALGGTVLYVASKAGQL